VAWRRKSNAIKQTAELVAPLLRDHSAAKSGLPRESKHTISPSRTRSRREMLWSSG
jgi:hypothetical protein